MSGSSVLAAAPPMGAAPAPFRDLWLLAGQSNAAGLGAAADLAPELTAPQPAHIWRGAAFEPYDAQTNAGGSAAASHGVEARLLHHLGAVDLVKSGEGGAALQYGTGEWNGTRNWHSGAVDGLWVRFVDAVHAARLARLRSGVTPQLAGLVWIQGESDAQAGRSAQAYADDLTALIEASRSALASDLPWRIVMLNSAQGAVLGASEVAAIRDAQLAAAQVVGNAEVIDPDGIPLSNDGLHYDAAGLDMIGTRVFAA